MAVRHRHPAQPQLRLVEGEPDLEPPEELAMAEVDDDALLEEDLDTATVDEDDVDEERLAGTLEDLTHAADDELQAGEDTDELRCGGCGQIRPRAQFTDPAGGLCQRCAS